MSGNIQVEQIGNVLRMALDRSDNRNRIDTAMIRMLSAAYSRLADDPELRCGLVHAIGQDFTLGLDLPDVAPGIVSEGPGGFIAEGQVDPWGLFGRRCPKPVVVAVQGRCFTAGLELCAAADLIVAERSATFAQMEVTRGVMPFGGGTFRLPAMMGWHRAMQYLLTGDTFDAAEAVRLGLVTHLTPDGDALPRALEIAARISSRAPMAIGALLAHARLAQDEGIAATVQQIPKIARRLLATEDAAEGIRSLVERRDPVFKGR